MAVNGVEEIITSSFIDAEDSLGPLIAGCTTVKELLDKVRWETLPQDVYIWVCYVLRSNVNDKTQPVRARADPPLGVDPERAEPPLGLDPERAEPPHSSGWNSTLPAYLVAELKGILVEEWPLTERSSVIGQCLAAITAVYLARFRTRGSAPTAAATDAFETVSYCVDFCTVADAALLSALLWRTADVWRELLHDGDAAMQAFLADPAIAEDKKLKFTQRLVPGRAMCISVSNALLAALSADDQWLAYAARIRMFPYAVLPPSFEGISCRHRGAGACNKDFPTGVASVETERAVLAAWDRAVEFRQRLQLGAPAHLTAADYVLFLRVHRFLQDPAEYLTVCLGGTLSVRMEILAGGTRSVSGRASGSAGGGAVGKAAVVEEVLEEGETVDERLDCLVGRLREVEQFGQFLERCCTAAGKRKHRVPNHAVQLLTAVHVSPLAFIETFATVPQYASVIAAHVLVALRIAFQWVAGADEQGLLANWAANISIHVLAAYKKAQQALVVCLSHELLNECHEILGLELQTGYPSSNQTGNLPEAPPNHRSYDHTVPDPGALAAQNTTENTGQDACERAVIAGLGRFTAIAKTGHEQLRRLLMTPTDLSAWRDDAYLETPLPDDYHTFSHAQQLQQRWTDVLEKKKIDEDPETEVEPSERHLAQDRNLWRGLRTAKNAGLIPTRVFGKEEGLIGYFS
ncbi:hypothetical protein GNI_164820 [Gregarina niphandrodes]|uniref:Uncharacterized protein n=1 Tax=Gregarina niphandrodes TaxID=110365 RepID=A0A023AY71_GRENI|nr:hypothetical protein GNI_164820 [Gregarina niphandrodes]EZG43606.1 hypothetical protein GNI_164820 [Gregarina niphandrodes]|eukprot:XP_011133160.1 hypothetical protein GNI_164820 [Gregarina niphandrodes]